MDKKTLLKIENLKVSFSTARGKVTAVDGVDLAIDSGEVVGIVGESGCGKSVMSQTILRLLEGSSQVSYEGRILYQGRDVLKYGPKELQRFRGNEVAMIFQDPMTSLNPVYTIGNQIDEVLVRHQYLNNKDARKRTIELLEWMGIPSPPRCAGQYPHELSGGMQQRVMIAMALACEPKLLIADEPTTALDVTIQAQIMELLRRLNQELGMAILLITHDLGVIAEMCSKVKVMYLGQIIEGAAAKELLCKPCHPYTKGLIASIPKLDGRQKAELPAIPGTVPSLFDIPSGCRFSTRCKYAETECLGEQHNEMKTVSADHQVRCLRYQKIEQNIAGEVVL